MSKLVKWSQIFPLNRVVCSTWNQYYSDVSNVYDYQLRSPLLFEEFRKI